MLMEYSIQVQFMEDSVTLDAIDLRVLDLLQQDASLSNQALAERAHVSPATCLRRVRRLVETGVIEKQVAILSPEHLDAFEAIAVAAPEVQQCWRVAPGPDFVLVLQVPDMPAYHALVQRLFTQQANVRNVKTFFSVKRAKFEPRLALPAARG